MCKTKIHSLMKVLLLNVLILCGILCFVGCKEKEETVVVKYNVSVQQVEGGFITLSDTSAEANQEVLVNCYPQAGYEVVVVTVNGVAIKNGKFKMPEKDAVVTAYFQEVGSFISLREGTYTALAVGYNGVLSASLGNNYMTLTINEDNSLDAMIWEMYFFEMKNISYTRLGNKLFAEVEGFGDLVLHIVDEDTLVLKYEEQGNDHIVVYEYAEDCVIEDGCYRIRFNPNGRENVDIDVTLDKQGENVTLQISTDNGVTIDETINGTIKILGNRVYIQEDQYTFYVFTILERDEGQYINNIGRFKPNEEGTFVDYESYMDGFVWPGLTPVNN